MTNNSTVCVQLSLSVLSILANAHRNSYDVRFLFSYGDAVQAPSTWIRWHGCTLHAPLQSTPHRVSPITFLHV